jgi:hypothetical protein
VLDQLEREDRLGIVILGRPYHHGPGLNHGIPEEFRKLGYPVFSQSNLPLDEDLLERLFGDEVRAGVIRHPLEYIGRVEDLVFGQQQPQDLGGKIHRAPLEPRGVGAFKFQVRSRRTDIHRNRRDHRALADALFRFQGHRRESAGGFHQDPCGDH